MLFRFQKCAALVALAIGGAAGGCDPTFPEVVPPQAPNSAPEYIVVEYSSGLPDAAAPAAAVERSPSFADARRRARSAAIRPPDGCLDDSTPTVSLRDTCKVWVRELEAGLLDEGLQVVPWAPLVERERSKHLAPPAAAADAGADLVFLLDRLDLSDVTDPLGGERYRYFEADAQGMTRGARFIEPSARASLEGTIARLVGEMRAPGAIMALTSSVEGRAVLSSSGETIWRYRRTFTQRVGGRTGMRFLFGHYGSDPWIPVAPTGPVPLESSEAIRAERALQWLAAGRGPVGMPPFAAERLDLVHESAVDFSHAFRAMQ